MDSALLLWLQSLNEKGESAEFLEKVNSSQENVNGPSDFVKNSIMKSFKFQKLAKYEEEEISSRIEGG